MKTAEKITERMAVDLGMHELETGRKRWNYHRRLEQEPTANADNDIQEPHLSGAKVTFRQNYMTAELVVRAHSRSVGKDDYKYDEQIVSKMEELLIQVDGCMDAISTFAWLTVYSPTADKKKQLH